MRLTGREPLKDRKAYPVTGEFVPQNDLEAIGVRFVQAYNARDIETGLALSHPDVVAMPAVVHGVRQGYHGHDGVREWFASMARRRSWFEIALESMESIESIESSESAGEAGSADAVSGRLVIFGEMHLEGKSLSPWAAVLVIEDGLIVRQRSYLSTREQLEGVGVLGGAAET